MREWNEENEGLAEERRLWEERLREDAPQMSVAEREKIIHWLEQVLLDAVMCRWFREGRLSLRWDAIQDQPSFEVR